MTEPEGFPCGTCGAQPGADCLAPDGRGRVAHQSRRRAVERAVRHADATNPAATGDDNSPAPLDAPTAFVAACQPELVACPACAARPGEPCTWWDGYTTRTRTPHRQRWTAAILRAADAMNPPDPADGTPARPYDALAAR